MLPPFEQDLSGQKLWRAQLFRGETRGERRSVYGPIFGLLNLIGLRSDNGMRTQLG